MYVCGCVCMCVECDAGGTVSYVTSTTVGKMCSVGVM